MDWTQRSTTCVQLTTLLLLLRHETYATNHALVLGQNKELLVFMFDAHLVRETLWSWSTFLLRFKTSNHPTGLSSYTILRQF